MGRRKDIAFHIPVSNEAKEKSMFNTDKPSKKKGGKKKIYYTGRKKLTYYKKKPAEK